MRTIDSTVQTLLETQLGQEIVVVLEIFWTERQDISIQTFPPPAGSTTRIWYADRAIDGFPEVRSNIIALGEIDASVIVSQGGQAASVPVTLDDTDGEVKRLFDTNDLHKKPVRVWFWVEGTDFATKAFPIFLGQINSPVVWKEGDREFSFEIVNRIEDVEVGFSYEEGSANEVPEELIGKPWPLCFGTTINRQALKAIPSISGILAGGVGIKDFTLGNRIELADAISCPQTPIGFKCSGRYPNFTCNTAFETDQNCVQARCLELELLRLQLEEQSRYEFRRIVIFGGERFPQGEALTLDINGGKFFGQFSGTNTAPTNVFIVSGRRHPRYDPSTGSVVKDPVQTELDSRCPGSLSNGQDSDYMDIWSGPVWTGLRSSRISWENFRQAAKADFFWAGGGATVTLDNDREITYIANILPSTIHNVRAVRFLNGNEFLLDVPTDFYEVRETDYNGYTVTEIVFERPLSSESKESGGGWRDEIYITQTSTVGPNTVDIIEWFITTYTDYAIDSTSFDATRDKVEVYPMHFCLDTRPNLLTILQDIARQARCALWQTNDEFFIKYLPETPTPVATIVEDDILRDSAEEDGKGTLEVHLTPTEDLVTKMVCEWQKDFSPFIKKPNTLILRHNINRYGTHANKVDYFTYAHLDLVRKSATFWLIRESNSWKRIKLSVPLSFAFLEPFDAVTIDLPDVNATTFLGIVERAVLDSSGKQVNLEIWTPIRAGEPDAYNFAFPANIAESALFPTLEARDVGDAGSGTDPNFSAIAPPGHPLNPDRSGIVSGFGLGCNGTGVTSMEPGKCRGDHGDRNPSDEGDKKPGVDINNSNNVADVNGGTSPVSNGSGYGTGSNSWQSKLQNDKSENDAGRGREVAEGGGTGSSPGSGDNSDGFGEDGMSQEDLEKLPEDGGDAPYKCTVVVTSFNTKEVRLGVPTQCVCVPDGPSWMETYIFDQQAAASQFCDDMKGASACKGKCPCGVCRNCSTSCEGDKSQEGDGNLIGFDGGGLGGNPPAMTV